VIGYLQLDTLIQQIPVRLTINPELEQFEHQVLQVLQVQVEKPLHS
jgi:hypothetical protein